MNTRRQRDFDDGFDEESLFEDEEYRFDQLAERVRHGDFTNPRKRPHDRENRFDVHKAKRRRDLAGIKAWRNEF